MIDPYKTPNSKINLDNDIYKLKFSSVAYLVALQVIITTLCFFYLYPHLYLYFEYGGSNQNETEKVLRNLAYSSQFSKFYSLMLCIIPAWFVTSAGIYFLAKKKEVKAVFLVGAICFFIQAISPFPLIGLRLEISALNLLCIVIILLVFFCFKMYRNRS